MVFQFVLHLVLEEDELKAAPVTVKGLVDLKRTDETRSVGHMTPLVHRHAGERAYVVS